MHTFVRTKKQICSLRKEKVKQQHSDIDEHPLPGAEYLTAARFLSTLDVKVRKEKKSQKEAETSSAVDLWKQRCRSKIINWQVRLLNWMIIVYPQQEDNETMIWNYVL